MEWYRAVTVRVDGAAVGDEKAGVRWCWKRTVEVETQRRGKAENAGGGQS